VSESWQFVLNEHLGSFSPGNQAPPSPKAYPALQAIAAEPLQKGDFAAKDDTGRSIQIKVAGSFLISFWPDAFVRELRIINIEWI